MVLRAALAAQGLTQTDLARRLGPTLQYLHATMTGRRKVSAKWVDAVADALRLGQDERTALHRAAALDQGYKIEDAR